MYSESDALFIAPHFPHTLHFKPIFSYRDPTFPVIGIFKALASKILKISLTLVTSQTCRQEMGKNDM